MRLTRDKKPRRSPRGAHWPYAAALRKIAAQIGRIVKGFSVEDPSFSVRIESALNQYAKTLHKWATNTASNMLIDVAQRDEKTWKILAKDMSRALRNEIRTAPTGAVMRQLLDEQVTLIQR